MDAEVNEVAAFEEGSHTGSETGASNPEMGAGNRNIQALGHCGLLVYVPHGRLPRERDHPL